MQLKRSFSASQLRAMLRKDGLVRLRQPVSYSKLKATKISVIFFLCLRPLPGYDGCASGLALHDIHAALPHSSQIRSRAHRRLSIPYPTAAHQKSSSTKFLLIHL